MREKEYRGRTPPELLTVRSEVGFRDEAALDDVAIGLEEGDLGGAQRKLLSSLRVPAHRG